MTRVLVTGSSTGLGLLAARLLAGWGHQVTLHARNASRAADARRELPGVPVVVGDLASIEQTRAVAAQVNALGPHQAVIHNAGVYLERHRVETVDGLAQVFAVNVLAPYLLTVLVDRPDRLVYLTSGMQAGGTPALDDAQWTRRRWSPSAAYADSKLLDTTLAFAVARRWPAVRSNSVDPGWVPTRMGGPAATGDLALGPVTQAWLAAGDDPAADVTGRHFYHQRSYPAPAAARHPAVQDALLDYCAGLTGEPFPA